MKINSTSQPFNVKLAFTLLSLLAIGYIAILGKEILAPFVFAVLFSILLLPVAQFLENKCGFRRNLAAITSVLLLLACISGLLYFLGAQMSRLGDDWPMFKEQLNDSITSLRGWISQKFHVTASKQTHYVNDATTRILNTGTMVAGETLLSVSSILLSLVFTLIYTLFFLLYRGLIMKFLLRVCREENEELVHDIIEQVQYIIRKYIVGLLLEMFIVASFVSIVFTIMGVKYAVLLGVLTGLLNVIPYIGIFSALVISSLITFATAAVATKVLWVAVVLLSTHLVDSNVLLPLIVGSKVKINAMITVLGVVVGELIWGIPGMFLSIPVIAVLKIIFDRIESMKPWGLLLGEEDPASKPAIDKITGNEPSLEQDTAPGSSAEHTGG